MTTKSLLRCKACKRDFPSERALAIHACKAHDDCSDRLRDRHAPRYTIGIDRDDPLGKACAAEAKRRGISMAELARLALTRLVKP